MKKTISIIVPTYNSADKLELCLESLLQQNYKDIEIIVVDDGSIDRTVEVINRYVQQDDRVIGIHKKNGGVSSARNEGLNRATGEYIMFVDADDTVERNYCEEMLKAIEGSQAELAICGYRTSIGEEVLPITSGELFISRVEEAFEQLYKNSITCLCVPWNKIFKKESIYKYFNETITWGEDLRFNLTFMEKINQVVLLGCPLYNYYLTESEKSLNKQINSMVKHLRGNVEAVIHFCDEKKINSEWYEDNYYLQYFANCKIFAGANIKKLTQLGEELKLVGGYNDVIKDIKAHSKRAKFLRILLKYKSYPILALIILIKDLKVRKDNKSDYYNNRTTY